MDKRIKVLVSVIGTIFLLVLVHLGWVLYGSLSRVGAQLEKMEAWRQETHSRVIILSRNMEVAIQAINQLVERVAEFEKNK